MFLIIVFPFRAFESRRVVGGEAQNVSAPQQRAYVSMYGYSRKPPQPDAKNGSSQPLVSVESFYSTSLSQERLQFLGWNLDIGWHEELREAERSMARCDLLRAVWTLLLFLSQLYRLA